MDINDPFEDLSTVAASLGPGWFACSATLSPSMNTSATPTPHRFERNGQGPSVIAGLEACVSALPRASSSTSTRRGISPINVGPGHSAKSFIAEKDQSVRSSWEAMATYFYFNYGPRVPSRLRDVVQPGVLPFRTDVDSIYDHTSQEHRLDLGAVPRGTSPPTAPSSTDSTR